jgi:hypothetical protein
MQPAQKQQLTAEQLKAREQQRAQLLKEQQLKLQRTTENPLGRKPDDKQ